MITKSYSIMCDKCTTSEGLFSGSLKDCREEAKKLGWVEVKGMWLCNECKDKKRV